MEWQRDLGGLAISFLEGNGESAWGQRGSTKDGLVKGERRKSCFNSLSLLTTDRDLDS